jgi:hypothetical protein
MTDALDRWMRESAVRDRNAWAKTTDLFHSYRSWCASNGAGASVGIQQFCRILKTNLIKRRLKRGRGYAGLKLKEHNG